MKIKVKVFYYKINLILFTFSLRSLRKPLLPIPIGIAVKAFLRG